MREARLEDRLRRLRAEAPPPGLRARVLAAAALVEGPEPSRADRLWFSRRARFGWAAAVAGLLLVEVAVDRALDDRLERAFAAPPPPDAGWEALAGEIGLDLEWMERRAKHVRWGAGAVRVGHGFVDDLDSL